MFSGFRENNDRLDAKGTSSDGEKRPLDAGEVFVIRAYACESAKSLPVALLLSLSLPKSVSSAVVVLAAVDRA